MPSKKIQDIVDRFVADIMAAAEEDALESIQERLGIALTETRTGRSGKTFKRRKSTKGKSILRPCPIKGCKNTAAPRYQMVCKEHSESLSREEIVVARDKAEKPGGIWYKMKHQADEKKAG